MPILADYHMHSSFSGDSRAPMQDMAARAIALGYQEICFTEHMDLHYPASEECPEDMFLLNTDSYLYDLLRAREKFGEQINICLLYTSPSPRDGLLSRMPSSA